jgi:putative transposase
MGTIIPRKGVKVIYDGEVMTIIGATDISTLALKTADGHIVSANIAELAAAPKTVSTPQLGFDPIRESKVAAYAEAFKPILALKRPTRADVTAASEKLSISTSSAYNALKRFRESGRVDSLPPPTRPGGRGKSRLDPAIEAIIIEAVEDFVMKPGRKNFDTFRERIRKALERAGLRVSEQTIRVRFNRISPDTRTRRAKGYAKARSLNAPLRGKHPGGEAPFSTVQIDHWKADIELVSDDRLTVIGRPWITIVIDVYTRLIVGLHVSLAEPGMTTLGLALISTMTSKYHLIETFGLDGVELPPSGKPACIETDNAKEFTGEVLKAFCDLHNITLKHRPVGAPQYGGYVERFNGTLAKSIRLLPGATGASIKDRGERGNGKPPALTLTDFERHVWMLVSEYHQKPHSQTGMAPLEAYKAYFFDPQGRPRHILPTIYVDDLEFRIPLYPIEMRTFQKYGIRIDHLDYFCEEIDVLVRNREQYGKVEIRRDPFDVRIIYLRHPDHGNWIRVPTVHTSFPQATVLELKEAKREALARSRAPTPAFLRELIQEKDRHIEEAEKLTRRATREKQKRSHIARIRQPKEGQAKPLDPGSAPFLAADTAKITPHDGNYDLEKIIASVTDAAIDRLFDDD